MSVRLSEKCGSSGPRIDYAEGSDSRLVEVAASSSTSISVKGQGLKHLFCSVFLPQDYPKSVSEDYLQYQLWDSLQAFCSSIMGALSAQALLKGFGVGDELATPLAASLTWILKEGAGMVTSITFAWWQGSNLDSSSKAWRLVADVMNDVSLFFDLLSPLFPKPLFPVVICFSSVARAIVGVAGRATRASLAEHQARQDNMADVAAKEASQETLVNLSALITSLIMLPLIGSSLSLAWILFVVATFMHLFSNYKAMKSLRFETLNQARLLEILQVYLPTGSILSIDEANSREPLVIFSGLNDTHVCGFKINMGVSFKSLLSNNDNGVTGTQFSGLVSLYEKQKFFMTVDNPHRTISVVLHQDISQSDMLYSYFHAVILGRMLSCSSDKFNEELLIWESVAKPRSEPSDSEHIFQIQEKSFKIGAKSYQDFLKKLKTKGWTTDHSLLSHGDWRSSWSC